MSMNIEELKSLIYECISEIQQESAEENEVICADEECEYFVENNFLQFVNESVVEDEKKLQKIIDKFKVDKKHPEKQLENEVTEQDIKDAVELIKKLGYADNKLARKWGKNCIMAFISYISSDLLYAFDLVINGTRSTLTKKIALVNEIYSLIMVLVSFTGFVILQRNVFDRYYDKAMKLEAKAKVKLKMVEGLDDKKDENEDKIKYYKAIIANCEKLRSNYKTIMDKIENSEKSTNNKYGEFKECFSITESGEVELIQEMKGNQMKIELFKQITDDIDEVLRARYGYLVEAEKNIDNLLKTVKSVKTKEEAAKAIVELKQNLREFNSKNDSNEYLYNKAFNDINKSAHQFTIKYAYDSQKVKKAVQSKIDSYVNKIVSIGKKYDAETGSLNTQIFEAIDNLELSDSFGENSARMIAQFENIMTSWQNGIATMCNNTVSACNKVSRSLGLNNEKSIIFKILNMKERRAEKKKNKEK